MTHDMLVERADRWLRSQGCGAVVSETVSYTSSGEVPDAIGWRSGVSILVECKTSRADFHADKKKHFRRFPENGMGDWRFFLCPDGVIKVEDLPTGWGLLYVKGKIIKRVHGYPPNTRWCTARPFSGSKSNELILMTSHVRRLEEIVNKPPEIEQ